MEVKIIAENKKDFLPLLLLADEQESMIDKYLERGTLFALYDDGLKSICVVTDEGEGTFEIQNLATQEPFQGRGYGRYLINHVCEYYRGQGTVMVLGTGDIPAILSFYQRSGFTLSHRIANYFVENYQKPMYEGGIQLVDKVYLKRHL